MTNSGRILIVDDDPSVQRLLAAIAVRNQLEPVVVGDGKAALRWLDAEPFDAIVLELLLPKVSGTEVLQHLSDALPHLLERTIVATAAAESLYLSCPYAAATWAVVRKPLEIEDLEQELLECYAEHLRSSARRTSEQARHDIVVPLTLRAN